METLEGENYSKLLPCDEANRMENPEKLSKHQELYVDQACIKGALILEEFLNAYCSYTIDSSLVVM